MDEELPIFCKSPNEMNIDECIKEINRIENWKKTGWSLKLNKRQSECFERLELLEKQNQN